MANPLPSPPASGGGAGAGVATASYAPRESTSFANSLVDPSLSGSDPNSPVFTTPPASDGPVDHGASDSHGHSPGRLSATPPAMSLHLGYLADGSTSYSNEEWLVHNESHQIPPSGTPGHIDHLTAVASYVARMCESDRLHSDGLLHNYGPKSPEYIKYIIQWQEELKIGDRYTPAHSPWRADDGTGCPDTFRDSAYDDRFPDRALTPALTQYSASDAGAGHLSQLAVHARDPASTSANPFSAGGTGSGLSCQAPVAPMLGHSSPPLDESPLDPRLALPAAPPPSPPLPPPPPSSRRRPAKTGGKPARRPAAPRNARPSPSAPSSASSPESRGRFVNSTDEHTELFRQCRRHFGRYFSFTDEECLALVATYCGHESADDQHTALHCLGRWKINWQTKMIRDLKDHLLRLAQTHPDIDEWDSQDAASHFEALFEDADKMRTHVFSCIAGVVDIAAVVADTGLVRELYRTWYKTVAWYMLRSMGKLGSGRWRTSHVFDRRVYDDFRLLARGTQFATLTIDSIPMVQDPKTGARAPKRRAGGGSSSGGSGSGDSNAAKRPRPACSQ